MPATVSILSGTNLGGTSARITLSSDGLMSTTTVFAGSIPLAWGDDSNPVGLSYSLGTLGTVLATCGAGLRYIRAQAKVGETIYYSTDQIGVWVGSSNLQEDDALSLKLQSIVQANVAGLNAAWSQMGTGVATMVSGDIYIGDRERFGTKGTGTAAICILAGDHSISREDGYIPQGFRGYATRVLMLYVRHDDEYIRERVAQTLTSALRNILNKTAYQQITADDGNIWYASFVEKAEYGEAYKYGQFVLAARLTWTAWRVGEFP